MSPVPTIEEIREKIARPVDPYTDGVLADGWLRRRLELRVLLARIDDLEVQLRLARAELRPESGAQ
ncbi:MAG: hypothetical protein JWN04_4039 [Myxococcaceae bacterium]|nr:hypothetical protein [Myxococcaceae bacterium]